METLETLYTDRLNAVHCAVNAYCERPTKKNLLAAEKAIFSKLCLANSGTRLPWMLELADELGLCDELFWRVFKNSWSSCDWTWDYRMDLLEVLRAQSSRPPLSKRTRFPLVVYRGCQPDHVFGISWSRSRKVAGYFGTPCRNNLGRWGVVARGVVEDPSAVFFYNSDRKEREVVLDPAMVKITSVTDMQSGKKWAD